MQSKQLKLELQAEKKKQTTKQNLLLEYLADKYKNDMELGANVRKIFNNTKNLEGGVAAAVNYEDRHK